MREMNYIELNEYNYKRAVRSRLKYINLYNTKNSTEFEKSGLISLRFFTHVFATRNLTQPVFYGYDIDEEDALTFVYQWYDQYLQAIYEIFLTLQKAAMKNQLIVRNELTKTPIHQYSNNNLVNMDVKDKFQICMEEFKNYIRPYTWPDKIFMPDGGAYANDLTLWAEKEGMASADEVFDMLKLSNRHVEEHKVTNSDNLPMNDICNAAQDYDKPTVSDGISLMPLTTPVIANCFAELNNFTIERWKNELGSPKKWLLDCQASKGDRPEPSTWFPVLIGGVIIKKVGAKDRDRTIRMVSARFQSQDPLKPWLEAWEKYQRDNFDTE